MPDGLRRNVPVLTYHSIDDSGSPVSVSAREFHRQMQALVSAGWRTIGTDAFMRGHRQGGWPPRTFVLTFDDGFRNLIEKAMPIAADAGFSGTVFVATGRVGGTMKGAGEPAWIPDVPLLDWNGLRSLAAAGWSIASHADTHRRLPALPADEVTRELTASKARIEDEIGAPVTAFAYPYGAASAAVERAAAEHYEAAFGTRLAHVTSSSRAANFERIDAYYLRGLPAMQLDGRLFRSYLALRRAARTLRARSL